MKKFLIQIVLLVIVILASTFYVFQPGSGITGQNPFASLLTGTAQQAPVNQIKIGQTPINIEIADTDQKRTQGLSGRDALASDSGMFFEFSNLQRPRFWMKGMKFPLDLIFIKDNTVVDILQNVPAPQSGTPDDSLPLYEPITDINKAVEVNAGFVASHNIVVGDTVELQASPSP